MKKRLRTTFLLICILLLLVNGFQFYMLFTRYRQSKQQYASLINTAFYAAVGEYVRLSTLPGSSTIESLKGIAISVNKLSGDTQPELKNLSVEGIKGFQNTGPMLIRLSNGKTSFDARLLDSLFSKTLIQNGIKAKFLLDTANNKSQGIHRPEGYAVQTNLYYLLGDGTAVLAFVQEDRRFLYRDLFGFFITGFLILLIANGGLFFTIKTIRQQKKIAEIKNDFVNNMTHELQTPLTIALSGIDAILNHHGLADRQKTNYYLTMSKTELQQLSGQIDKIMHMAAEEKTSIQLAIAKTDIAEVLHSVIRNNQLTASKQVSFEFVQKGDPRLIQADQFHITAALNNIVDNAIKYSPEPVRIQVHLIYQENVTTIRIKDNGPGIARSYQSEIFKNFFRVPQHHQQEVKGYGIGLYYVKNIIEKHNGSVSVHSSPNEGSEFIVTLP